ncbi:MAG: hypothetical protein A2X22_05350 [Bacteroidetes bacterium GWF2_49_14]|nr:MAG: hypothetical protein A2X22_05350 [Bacteroidetes bacterium GWF2_49_14]HBB93615.1 hypothetical protein [Bacteroidales bacterium]
MDLKDYISIAGMPGLYKLISQGKNVIIVENLETGQRMPSHEANRVSSLEEIALFTKGEDKPLKDIFLEIFKKEEGKAVPDPKKAGSDELRDYFATIVPEYDRLKVYVSDIKKVLIWYNILVTSGKVDFTGSPAEE